MNRTNLPQIIGITGKKFSGKDTIGLFLIEKYGYKRIAYADALKEACKNIFGFTDEQLNTSKKEEIDDFWKIKPRQALQYVGTELLREQIGNIIPSIGKNIWVEVIRKKINDELKINKDTKFVITDVRFENEADLIKELNGIIISVKRNTNQLIDEHKSENEINKIKTDYEVENNSTIEALYENIEMLF